MAAPQLGEKLNKMLNRTLHQAVVFAWPGQPRGSVAADNAGLAKE